MQIRTASLALIALVATALPASACGSSDNWPHCAFKNAPHSGSLNWNTGNVDWQTVGQVLQQGSQFLPGKAGMALGLVGTLISMAGPQQQQAPPQPPRVAAQRGGGMSKRELQAFLEVRDRKRDRERDERFLQSLEKRGLVIAPRPQQQWIPVPTPKTQPQEKQQTTPAPTPEKKVTTANSNVMPALYQQAMNTGIVHAMYAPTAQPSCRLRGFSKAFQGSGTRTTNPPRDWDGCSDPRPSIRNDEASLGTGSVLRIALAE